jgi:hypothetical protein
MRKAMWYVEIRSNDFTFQRIPAGRILITTTHKVNLPLADIVYDSNAKVWHCCSYPNGFTPNCTAPSNQQFNAPAPGALLTVQVQPATGYPSYMTGAASATPSSSSTSTSPTSSSTSAPTSSASSGGLSPGASAGIGVGVALGVIALVGLLTIFILRRRRRKLMYPSTSENHSGAQSFYGYGHAPSRQPVPSTPLAELGTNKPTHELDPR